MPDVSNTGNYGFNIENFAVISNRYATFLTVYDPSLVRIQSISYTEYPDNIGNNNGISFSSVGGYGIAAGGYITKKDENNKYVIEYPTDLFSVLKIRDSDYYEIS